MGETDLPVQAAPPIRTQAARTSTIMTSYNHRTPTTSPKFVMQPAWSAVFSEKLRAVLVS